MCIRDSAKTGYGLDALLKKLDELLSYRVHTIRVLLPYDKLGLAADVYKRQRRSSRSVSIVCVPAWRMIHLSSHVKVTHRIAQNCPACKLWHEKTLDLSLIHIFSRRRAGDIWYYKSIPKGEMCQEKIL